MGLILIGLGAVLALMQIGGHEEKPANHDQIQIEDVQMMKDAIDRIPAKGE